LSASHAVLRDIESPRDYESIAAIHRLCFEGPVDLAGLAGVDYTLADYGSVTAGYCISSWGLLPSRLMILSLAVHPEFRRCGVATEMLEAMQAAAVVAGRKVRMIASSEHWALSECLHSIGFRIVGEQYGMYAFEWGFRNEMVRRVRRRSETRPLPR
jgi:ribosomal protein S18 acetylase RimI-like enzyme